MKNRKPFLILLFTAFFISSVFSQSLGIEILKNSDFSVNGPVALTTASMRNYAKTDYGLEFKFATKLAYIDSKKISIGLCSDFFYSKYGYKREEIKTFFVRGFTEGLWIENSLPEDFFVRTEINAGLGITKVKAESIYEKKIENNYNSFVFGICSSVNRKIYDFGPVAFFWNAGPYLKFFKEEDSTNADIGLTGGITLKAGSKWH